LGETRSVSKEISPKEKRLYNTSRWITSARRQLVYQCFDYKTLLWTHVGEDKELIQKVKEEGRTCQERKEQERLYFEEKKRNFTYKNQKIYN
jgi:hypothetical protein